MIFRTATLFLLTVSGAIASSNLRSHEESAKLEDCPHKKMFMTWTETHDKEYESDEHMMERMKVWMENHKLIEAHNNQEPKPKYFLGHNEYSDMTSDRTIAVHRTVLLQKQYNRQQTTVWLI